MKNFLFQYFRIGFKSRKNKKYNECISLRPFCINKYFLTCVFSVESDISCLLKFLIYFKTFLKVNILCMYIFIFLLQQNADKIIYYARNRKISYPKEQKTGETPYSWHNLHPLSAKKISKGTNYFHVKYIPSNFRFNIVKITSHFLIFISFY